MPLGRWFAVPAIALVLCSCSGSRVTTGLPPAPPPGPRLAEEVKFSTGPEAFTGKFTELRGDSVVFLSPPYWRVESRTFALQDIAAVQLERTGNGQSGFLLGFALGFTAIGVVAGTSARYDEDYSNGLILAVAGGTLTGLLGMVTGGQARTTVYDLRRMSVESRAEVVRRLMAQDRAAPAEEGTWQSERSP